MAVLSTLFQVLLLFLSFIMIVLVLLQRGRGGGLAGAFGGMGGQSAFGTKAGDVFTRITIVVAILWVLSAGLMGLTARASQNSGSKAGLPSEDEVAAGAPSEKSGDIRGDAAPKSPAGTEAGNSTKPGAATIPEVPPSTAPPASAPPGDAAKPAPTTTDKAPSDTSKAPEPPKPLEPGKP